MTAANGTEVVGTDDRERYVGELLQRSIEVKRRIVAGHLSSIVAMADVCVAALAKGGKLMLCGNGGSAADAQHLAAEMLVRLRPSVNRDGVPAIALAMDASSMTACGNDYSYEVFFERMLRALAKPGDVFIVFTTSGKSPNILRALVAAREIGVETIGFLGCGGGPALPFVDTPFIVPSDETGRIQEAHITVGHALMELIEDGLLASGAIRAL